MSMYDTFQMLTKIADQIGNQVIVGAHVIPGLAQALHFRVFWPDGFRVQFCFLAKELDTAPTDVFIGRMVAEATKLYENRS